MLFSLIRNQRLAELYFSGAATLGWRPVPHLAIVSSPTLNYNAYDAVETAYETFALAVSSRLFWFADRLRGRATGAPDAPPVPLPERDAGALSANPATVRSECRSAAAGHEHATGGTAAAADSRDCKQTDQGRSALRDSGAE